MAKRTFFNGDDPYVSRRNRTKYRNQGYQQEYNGSDPYSLKERRESYDKWVENGSKAPRNNLNIPEMNQVGVVHSSWLNTLGYNANTGEAFATFKDSSGTFYYKMSYETFLNWLNSPSKGTWLWRHPEYMRTYTEGASVSKGAGIKFVKSHGAKAVAQAKTRQQKYMEKYR